MSVIIRLQNLPWNANALDIRRFFQGLSIPDGGVHIIGGEKGDAFIAFSTDEDARQAMMKDGGRINGYAIKLLLSSKTEMQNVIAAAKGGPPPVLPAASSMAVPKPGGFFERAILPPVGGQVPFVGGSAGGNVASSGQGLRSSTGLPSLPQAVPYGYPGSTSQVVQPAQPMGYVVRMNEPVVGMPAVPAMPPPAVRSIFDTRPAGNLQQPPPAAPMDPLGSGLRPSLPGPPPAAPWSSQQPPPSRDVPPPNFGRPADIPSAQGPGFGALNPSVGREPVRVDGGRQPDMGYPRNGHAYGAPESGRNFIPGLDAGRNLGPPPDVSRDFGRRNDGQLGRREEPRDSGRFGENVRSWDRGDRNAAGPAQGWSSGGRSFSGRDGEDSRREFQRSDVDRGIPSPDRWQDTRNMGPDRGRPREVLPNEGQRPRPGAADFNDRFDRGRPAAFPEPGSRYGPDSGPREMPDSRMRGDYRDRFAHPEPGFREPARPLMEENTRRPPEERWVDERRSFGPPSMSRYEERPQSPPRDRSFQGGFFPRDEPWRNEHSDFDTRQLREQVPDHSLSVRAENFPRTFNYRDVRRILSGCEIPRDGVKLINDEMGMRTGVVFVHFADARSHNRALGMNGIMVSTCRITVERCTDAEFDAAVDGKPMKRVDRSRSPRSRQVEENSNMTYFVLKKLPAKTEKEDIRKFLGKFRIAAEGGPFFELAFDKSQTGNALVALEEKEVGKVLTLHHSMLNGTRVDVVRINSYEFAERSRRARQLERDGDKNAAQSKPPNTRDAKTEKQDPKSKEVDRKASSTVEDDSEQHIYCVELRGIPYTASPAMIQDFFHDISFPVESIHISYNREHRATGIAFVELTSMTDQKKALEKDKQHMGHRVVDIRPLSKMAMIEEYNKQQRKFGGPLMTVPSSKSNTDHPKQGSKVLLSMQNLHYDTQLEDILDFFSGYQPIVDSIQLQYKDNQPTGDGLVAFGTLQEAESALRNKNRHLLRGKPVTLAWPKN